MGRLGVLGVAEVDQLLTAAPEGVNCYTQAEENPSRRAAHGKYYRSTEQKCP